MTQNLEKFFELNADIIQNNLPKYKEKLATYRKNIKHVYFDDKENTLSYELTFKIYNEITLTKEQLKDLFLKEKNPEIKKIGENIDKNEKIQSLYNFMTKMSESMSQCWWILFWHDLWNLNKFFKGYAKSPKTNDQSHFNVYKDDNIAQEYEKYKDADALKKLLISENKFKYFTKRNLFQNILTMLDKIRSKDDIQKAINNLSENDRRILELDDYGDLESGYSRLYSPKGKGSSSPIGKGKGRGFFSKHQKKKTDGQTLESLEAGTQSRGNSPDLKTSVIQIHSAGNKISTEDENLISKGKEGEKDVLDELVEKFVEEEKKNEKE